MLNSAFQDTNYLQIHFTQEELRGGLLCTLRWKFGRYKSTEFFLTTRTFEKYILHFYAVNFTKEVNGKILKSKAGDHQKLSAC